MEFIFLVKSSTKMDMFCALGYFSLLQFSWFYHIIRAKVTVDSVCISPCRWRTLLPPVIRYHSSTVWLTVVLLVIFFHSAFLFVVEPPCLFHYSIKPAHDKTNKMACAPSKDWYQPGHPPSLIRMLYAQWVAKEPRCHADSEDPGPTGHVTCYFVGFVVRWFNYFLVLIHWWVRKVFIFRKQEKNKKKKKQKTKKNKKKKKKQKKKPTTNKQTTFMELPILKMYSSWAYGRH